VQYTRMLEKGGEACKGKKISSQLNQAWFPKDGARGGDEDLIKDKGRDGERKRRRGRKKRTSKEETEKKKKTGSRLSDLMQ